MHDTGLQIKPMQRNDDGQVTSMAKHIAAFARHMAELRKHHGWSQAELGRQTGTAGAVIGRYERAEITPSIDAAKKIADALGASLDYMTSDETLSDPLREREIQARCRVLASLPDKDQECITYAMDGLIRDAKARITYT
jgi:transcriptional regulator with XRE-family HTH domain